MKTAVLTSAWADPQNQVHKAGETVELTDDQYKELSERKMLQTKRGPTEQVLLQRQIARKAAQERGFGFGFEDESDYPTPPPERELVFLPVTPQQYSALQAAGYATPDTLSGATLDELSQIPGIDPETAEKILSAVNQGQKEGSSGEEEEGADEAPPAQPTKTQQATRLAGRR